MQDEDRKAIQNNFISLVEQTDLDVMVSSLYEKGVFSERMIEPYKDVSKDAKYRKRQLYLDVTRRGPQAFGHLLDALSENGYWDIVRDLDPNSSLHARRQRNPVPSTSVGSNEKNYVSLCTEKLKTKNATDVNKNPAPQAPRAPAAPARLPDPTTIPHFHVVKSTTFFEDNDSDIPLYRTRGRRRGFLVVFSYVEFNNLEPYRNGVDVDCKNLKYLFDEIGFKVISYQDLTKSQTLETLKGLKEVVVGAECVFIVVSSHGYERPRSSDNDIRCKDGGLIAIRDIIDYFNNKNFPALQGVPKVFIFQLCRGNNEESVWRPGAETDGASRGASRGAPPAPAPPLLAPPDAPAPRDRVYSDILIAHSTVPGNVAYRDNAAGSWYIQALCEVFAARAHDCHVEKLFTLVDKRLHAAFLVQTSSVDRWGFNCRLYLHPGLYESQ
nr:caspase Dronc [Vanessa tameamea]